MPPPAKPPPGSEAPKAPRFRPQPSRLQEARRRRRQDSAPSQAASRKRGAEGAKIPKQPTPPRGQERAGCKARAERATGVVRQYGAGSPNKRNAADGALLGAVVEAAAANHQETFLGATLTVAEQVEDLEGEPARQVGVNDQCFFLVGVTVDTGQPVQDPVQP